ncbi:hypothetical protein FQP85_01625 [Pseudoalteromonas neustonica]|uniref:Fibronectin type III domain-containing protein n=1 Tax=Pseudoalteromonas neustonica TaxID=1840331 RepID=A0ABY3FIL9_9GAMM|nr:hypothetical protein [Pseudoalteromonas neustonica]TVU85808.1 hypothetical protein FQP85_01625 [Pseudoalteromonas neustonica]
MFYRAKKRIISSLLYICLLIFSSIIFAGGLTFPGGEDVFETPKTPTNFSYANDGNNINISWNGGSGGNSSFSYAFSNELLTRSFGLLPCNGSCNNSKTFTVEVSENEGAYRVLTSNNTNNTYRFELTGKQNYRFRIKAVNVYTFTTPYTYRSSGYLVSPLIAKLNKPVISPSSTSISASTAISISSSQGGSHHYKLVKKGTACGTSGFNQYTVTFTLSTSKRVCAKAIQSNWFPSDIVYKDYEVVETQVTFIHTDLLGSVIAESNGSGAVINKQNYKPFGEKKDN